MSHPPQHLTREKGLGVLSVIFGEVVAKRFLATVLVVRHHDWQRPGIY